LGGVERINNEIEAIPERVSSQFMSLALMEKS